MEELRLRILQVLDKEERGDTRELAKLFEVEHDLVVGAIKSLETIQYIVCNKEENLVTSLTAEGAEYLKNGSPEYQVYQYLLQNPNSAQADIITALGEVGKIGFSKAMAGKLIEMNKETKSLVPSSQTLSDPLLPSLQHIHNHNHSAIPPKAFDELKKRKIASQNTLTFFTLSKGPLFSLTISKPQASLTSEMIMNNTFQNATFKPYNLHSNGKIPLSGNLHPLLKVRQEFRTILLDMGFEEMPTNQWIESSFWNFDALFQPQQHPARDAHDTFFIQNPSHTPKENLDQDYFEKVRKVHEEGGWGSKGWRYDWEEKEALSNILRTHTTSVSSRMLYALSQVCERDGNFVGKKYFSIDRVFRNEKLDATHLAEFHQVEGFIADRDLSLGHLMEVIRTFFRRIGIEDVWFKPAYNPYTEPSMEIFGYHPILKKRVEIGNSGMFRPEMLRAMGLPADVRVIAWGLSLERPTMISYGIDNIRDLSGHKVDLLQLRRNPVCWMK